MDFASICLHLRQQPLTRPLDPRGHSLNGNNLSQYHDGRKWVSDMSRILKLAEALPHSQLTSLRWPTKAP